MEFWRSVSQYLVAKSGFERDFPLKCSCSHFRKSTYNPRRQIAAKHFHGFVLDTVGILPRTEHCVLRGNIVLHLPIDISKTSCWSSIAPHFFGNLKPMENPFWLSIRIRISVKQTSCWHWDSGDPEVGEPVTLDNWVITLRRPAAALCLWKAATNGTRDWIPRKSMTKNNVDIMVVMILLVVDMMFTVLQWVRILIDFPAWGIHKWIFSEVHVLSFDQVDWWIQSQFILQVGLTSIMGKKWLKKRWRYPGIHSFQHVQVLLHYCWAPLVQELQQVVNDFLERVSLYPEFAGTGEPLPRIWTVKMSY